MVSVCHFAWKAVGHVTHRCAYCKAFEAVFKQLAVLYSHRPDTTVSLVRIDGTENEIDHPLIRVMGFPALYLIPWSDRENPIEYDGDRSAEAIAHFIEGKLQEAAWKRRVANEPEHQTVEEINLDASTESTEAEILPDGEVVESLQTPQVETLETLAPLDLEQVQIPSLNERMVHVLEEFQHLVTEEEVERQIKELGFVHEQETEERGNKPEVLEEDAHSGV